MYYYLSYISNTIISQKKKKVKFFAIFPNFPRDFATV